MYITKIYYLLDTISETILGSFEAKSEAMARKILSTFDFDKAKLSKSDCFVCVYQPAVHHLETYDEVVKSELTTDCTILLEQEVFSFEDGNNDN